MWAKGHSTDVKRRRGGGVVLMALLFQNQSSGDGGDRGGRFFLRYLRKSEKFKTFTFRAGWKTERDR